MSNNIDFYNRQSNKIFEQYQSLSFESVHSSWFKKLDLHHYKTALDIGAGSGRDALALSNFGLAVTAVEPAQSLKSKAIELTGKKVSWLSDSLPDLSSLKQNTFDLILVSAVWMHLNPMQQEQSLFRISRLLNSNGIVIITFRHGDFDDGRSAFKINGNKLIENAKEFHFKKFHHDITKDELNRCNVSWETVALKKLS